MKNKQEVTKKASPVMKKLARAVSANEFRAVSGGGVSYGTAIGRSDSGDPEPAK